ncbi:DUF397 domain-containing protein [Dactylosporangium matsuzakiense]|nr:DUF397 domain-containing protein [Dactylosporangium matsuzakiense]UWZ49476.1 DUF397 domain-containing protein [Dactylosporangium matsuzakiense]
MPWPWRKSTRSPLTNYCVEWRPAGYGVEVRDSKDAGGPVLSFGTDAWSAFIAATLDGSFDRA